MRLRSHVEQILVDSGNVVGVRLRRGKIIKAPIVIANATIWDTYGKLLQPALYRAAGDSKFTNSSSVGNYWHTSNPRPLLAMGTRDL